jgi:23S rRNA pseudouridine955/2504/2580 synthase
MATHTTITYKDSNPGRLDKWFKKTHPEVPFSLLKKLLRKGAIRVNGKRAKSEQILKKGDEIKLPSIAFKDGAPKKFQPHVTDKDFEQLFVKNIIFEDKRLIIINKPHSLPTQGGTKVQMAVDFLLEYYNKKEEKDLKLVHRLDKDTSGTLIIAKDSKAANELMLMLKNREIVKKYWALIAGCPLALEGTVKLPLGKAIGLHNMEKIVVDELDGKKAVTHFRIIEKLSKMVSFAELEIETGRKHQIRVHMNEIECPIVGDGKYGGKKAFIDGLSNRMHLHARSIQHKSINGGKPVFADLPEHMKKSWAKLGLSISSKQ